MNFQDCIKFANENPVSFLATMDGDQPRVRGLLLCFADETGFYLQTGTMKSFVEQMKKNPKVELCFYNSKTNKSMRVTGKVEFVDDVKIRTKILEDRPFLKPWVKTADNPEFVVFKIGHGNAHFWTWETNLLPKEIISF